MDRDGRKKAIDPKNRLLEGIDPSASVEAMFKSQSMLKTRPIHSKQDSTLDLAEVTNIPLCLPMWRLATNLQSQEA